jgi:spore protease
MKFKIRTDLAYETRESFNDDVEIKGVSLKKKNIENSLITIIEIFSPEGAEAMHKPIGTYVTIENDSCLEASESDRDELSKLIGLELKMLSVGTCKKMPESILVVGIGNRNITSDSLGPLVVEGLNITSHIKRYLPDAAAETISLSAIAPGVMAQTGIETSEILKGIVDKIKPELVIAIDALAGRNLRRLNKTFQISNTGISPGAGLGNLRNEINSSTIGVPVIAIGVPTVVDVNTIVHDTLKSFQIEYLLKSENSKANINDELISDKFVTTKNIDEEVLCVSKILQSAINGAFF